jgi:hypothetical protein
MTIDEAARHLDNTLRPNSWYISTGIGSANGAHVLFVYVKSAKNNVASLIGKEWKGFQVIVRPIGNIRPLATPPTPFVDPGHYCI